MKIAYLISVYKDPQQFVRMLKALRGKETYFFIHVDAKVDDKIFIDNLPIDLLDVYKRQPLTSLFCFSVNYLIA